MKVKNFSHVTQNDRDRIEILLEQGYEQKEIAKVLNRSKSTISREIAGREVKGIYTADNAQKKARYLRLNSKYQGMKVEKLFDLQTKIVKELKEGASPDEIAGRMRVDNNDKTIVGKDAIYKWLYSVYGDKNCKYLCSRKKRKKLHKKKTEREMIPNRVSITERPQEGLHAEGDTLVSPKSAKTNVCASVVVIQKTKLISGDILQSQKPIEMFNSLNRITREIKKISDLTMDNGIENRWHEKLSIKSYFCDPYSPWQKPLVEQSIGILRRWCFKKGTDLSKINNSQYQEALNFLNHKKRKSLGYKSAYEVSLECGIIAEIPEKSVAFQYRI